MAAGLVVPISGPYVGTWNGKPFGTLSDDGYDLSCTIQGQSINESDAYGLTLVEAIYRGQNWRLLLRGLEWNKAGLLDSLQMFGQPLGTGTFQPSLGQPELQGVPGGTAGAAPIGDRWTKFCQAMVLTAILGNPPTTPQALTAINAGVAPDMNTRMLMTSKMRELPLEYVLIPYTATISSVSYIVPFTTA